MLKAIEAEVGRLSEDSKFTPYINSSNERSVAV